MHAITSCAECPLCEESCYCSHPARPQGEHSIFYAAGEFATGTKGEWHPEWCPLRKGDLLITLKARES